MANCTSSTTCLFPVSSTPAVSSTAPAAQQPRSAVEEDGTSVTPTWMSELRVHTSGLPIQFWLVVLAELCIIVAFFVLIYRSFDAMEDIAAPPKIVIDSSRNPKCQTNGAGLYKIFGRFGPIIAALPIGFVLMASDANTFSML